MDPMPTGTELEYITSLRRRGLLTAEAYQLHLAALGVRVSEAGPRSLGLHLFALIVTVLGCVLAIPGVVLQELQFGFLSAPIVEEAMKPAGVYILLLRWPRAVGGPLHTAVLCGIAGLTFGLIESLIYVFVYFPDEGSDFVLFRFTVTPVLHVVASFICGLGISRGVLDWAAGRTPFPKRTRNFYLAAAGLHGVYNMTAVVLALTGVLDFD